MTRIIMENREEIKEVKITEKEVMITEKEVKITEKEVKITNLQEDKGEKRKEENLKSLNEVLMEGERKRKALETVRPVDRENRWNGGRREQEKSNDCEEKEEGFNRVSQHY